MQNNTSEIEMIGPETEWIFEPGRRFIRYFIETSYILTLSIQGITEQGKLAQPDSVRRSEFFFKSFLGKYKEEVEQSAREELQKTLDLQIRLSFFAANEAEKGFPIIRSHTLVAFWGALEVFVDDLILAWLRNRPAALKSEGLSKVKVSLAEFETLDADERLLLLLDEMKHQAKANLTKGINRFEGVLKIIGLDGEVDKQIRDNLFRTQQLRNLIVHRGSLADKRFIETCPSLGFKVGDMVRLKESDYISYRDSIEDYVLCLTSRVLSRLGYTAADNQTIAGLIIRPVYEAMKPPVEINVM